VEFVQYLPRSIQMRNAGNFLSATRLSQRLVHVAFPIVNDVLDDSFYVDLLGFRRMWRGGPPANAGAWTFYLVPDGSDWLEYTTAGPSHISLEVKDIREPYDKVQARGYMPPEAPAVARDGRRMLNLYDPEGTRTEVIIRKPVETPCCAKLNDPYMER
jgi:lactoylglutathione lyase